MEWDVTGQFSIPRIGGEDGRHRGGIGTWHILVVGFQELRMYKPKTIPGIRLDLVQSVKHLDQLNQAPGIHSTLRDVLADLEQAEEILASTKSGSGVCSDCGLAKALLAAIETFERGVGDAQDVS